MILWLFLNAVRRAPRRLALAAVAVAFPVALVSGTLFYVDVAVHAMTPVALAPVQVEMRALATSLDVDMGTVDRQLAGVHGVRRVERFAAADVVVGVPGSTERSSVRLFAVDPQYLRHHPWVHTVSGAFDRGAMVNEPLHGLASAADVTIALPGAPRPLLTLPVGGVVDLRKASTWFAIPTGEVQGDLAAVPRAIVIDYATFDRVLKPSLIATLGAKTPVLNAGLTDLPPVDVEAHVIVDHAAYPADPARAVAWSAELRHVLERRAPGAVVVADDAAEALLMAQIDATNAKILFLLLGIPGVLVAAALGLATESALAVAHRREEALLRLRGATDAQLARLAGAQAAGAGLLGAAAGVLVAIATVSVVNGSAVWSDIPPGRLAGSLGLAVGVGAAIVAIRLVRLVRSGRHAQVTLDRRLLERGWAPTWRRARLDLVAIAVGVLILGINLLAGGLRATPVEGPPLALSFYVLLAPVALWIGVSLLAVRGLLVALARWVRPGRARPLSSWRGACLRWLGRRPARAAVALVIGTLAVAFGTEVVTFAATYSAARHADARAGFGADLRLTPAAETPADPSAAAGVAATTPIRFVPARIGSDRKTILTLDLSSYGKTATVGARMLTGAGVDALAQHPDGVLIAPEIAEGFAVGPGDPLPVTVFPDDGDHSRNFTYRVVGVFRSFPPTDPPAELVMATTGVPPFLLPSPETYLVRVAPGHAPAGVAAALRQGPVGHDFRVTTIADQELAGQRSLTTLNLAGLSTLESLAAGLIAAVGVAVLGAFVALERRREFAILRTLGANRRQVLTGAAQEGAISVFGSVILGVPIGLGIALVSVRVLGLFFVLPPPLLALAAGRLGLFLFLTVGTSAAALAVALVAINRVTAATALRE